LTLWERNDRSVTGNTSVEPLSYRKFRQLGVELVTATFEGCDFKVGPNVEMTIELPEGSFSGRISTFNIERVSISRIQTTVTVVRSTAWGKVREWFGERDEPKFIDLR